MSKNELDANNTKISLISESDISGVNIDDLRGFPKDGISTSGEITLNISGPNQLVGYIGIDLASGESRTVSFAKREIVNSFKIDKRR